MSKSPSENPSRMFKLLEALKPSVIAPPAAAHSDGISGSSSSAAPNQNDGSYQGLTKSALAIFDGDVPKDHKGTSEKATAGSIADEHSITPWYLMATNSSGENGSSSQKNGPAVYIDRFLYDNPPPPPNTRSQSPGLSGYYDPQHHPLPDPFPGTGRPASDETVLPRKGEYFLHKVRMGGHKVMALLVGAKDWVKHKGRRNAQHPIDADHVGHIKKYHHSGYIGEKTKTD